MLQFMDEFTVYGGDINKLFNGLYATLNWCSLDVDPDPNAGGERVLHLSANSTSNARRVLSAAETTVGVAARYWLSNLPPDLGKVPKFCGVSDTSNISHGYLCVNPTGYLQYYRTDNAGDVLVAQSASAVVIANAWRHVETKVVLDVAAGSVNVQLEGVNVLSVSGVRTTTDKGGAVASAQNWYASNYVSGSTTGAPDLYIKDLIVWDGSGASNNNFWGSCQVYRINPDSDVAIAGWTLSSGGSGFALIDTLGPGDDTSYISAPFPLPSASKFTLQDLPSNVTSVRAVQVLNRSRKTDGGDGQLQVGLISSGSTGLGSNRTITTAYTYWQDNYDLDPNGNIAWTRAAVNALQLQLNRTV